MGSAEQPSAHEDRPGLFPARLGLRLPRRELGFVLRLLARMAFLGPRLDLRPRLGELPQPLLAPRQLVRHRQAVGNVRRVGRFGFGHQVGDLGFQLRLDLAGHAAWLNQTRDVQLASAPLTGLIAVSDRYDRKATLAAGRIWQRLHLSATARGLAMQPLNQPIEMIDRERQTGQAINGRSASRA